MGSRYAWMALSLSMLAACTSSSSEDPPAPAPPPIAKQEPTPAAQPPKSEPPQPNAPPEPTADKKPQPLPAQLNYPPEPPEIPEPEPPEIPEADLAVPSLLELVDAWVAKREAEDADTSEAGQRAAVELLLAELEEWLGRHASELDKLPQSEREALAATGVEFAYMGEGYEGPVINHAVIVPRASAPLSPAARTYLELRAKIEILDRSRDEGGFYGDPDDAAAVMLGWDSLAATQPEVYRDAEWKADSAVGAYLRLCWADINTPACVVTGKMRESYERFVTEHASSRFSGAVAHFAAQAKLAKDKLSDPALDALIAGCKRRVAPRGATPVDAVPKILLRATVNGIGQIGATTNAELETLAPLVPDLEVVAGQFAYGEGELKPALDLVNGGWTLAQVLADEEGKVVGVSIDGPGIADPDGVQVGDPARTLRDLSCNEHAETPSILLCHSTRTGLGYVLVDPPRSGRRKDATPSSGAVVIRLEWGKVES